EYEDLTTTVIGTKTFEYLLLPEQEGRYTITPQVVVFNPDSAAYQTLRAQAFTIDVGNGSGESQSGLIAEADQNQGLYPPVENIRLRRASGSFFNTPLFWALFLLPILGVSGYALYEYRQANQPEIDPVLARQQRARQQALQRLEAAETHRKADVPKAFYEEVERALLGYVGDKLQIPRADMTKANVQAKLTELGASQEQSEGFLSIIRTCEMALYAGMDNADAMQATYEKAVTLLSDVEAALS
ncbi:MAG: BatD family protein, partial [Bacteroidota bacterium]